MFVKIVDRRQNGRNVEVHECDSVNYSKTSGSILFMATRNGREVLHIQVNEGVDFYILNDDGKTIDSVKW